MKTYPAVSGEARSGGYKIVPTPAIDEDAKLARFKKIGKSDMSTYKATLVPMMRDDKTVAGRVTAIVIGDCGSLDAK